MYTRLSLPSHYRGFLDRTHGGIVSTLLDEAMGWATVRSSDRFSYTAELKVRFVAPVPLATDLLLRGKVARHTRLLDFTLAELRGTDDQLMASAEAKFVLVSAEESKAMADALIYTPESWRRGSAE